MGATDFGDANGATDYDRKVELRAFNSSKAGVKGLVDAGVKEVPRIFVQEIKATAEEDCSNVKASQFRIPTKDLESMDRDLAQDKEIVDEVRDATETLGFFQVINHGIPVQVLEEMKDGVRQFFYRIPRQRKSSTQGILTGSLGTTATLIDPYKVPIASWRDTTFCEMAPIAPNAQDFSPMFRNILPKYAERVMKLGKSLFMLLSEALGLEPSHLEEMGCGQGLIVLCHYYPKCPEPKLTLGTTKHTDNDFLTVLL